MRCSGAGTFLPACATSCTASDMLAFQRQRVVKQRRVEHRLRQHRFDRAAVEVTRHLLERKAVRLAERQHDRVLGRRRLQLEIEGRQKRLRSARPKARLMRAPKGACMHQLHAARLIEEALDHERAAASAGCPASPWPRPGIRRSVRAADSAQAVRLHRDVDAACDGSPDRRPAAPHRSPRADADSGSDSSAAARRCFAQPERNGRAAARARPRRARARPRRAGSGTSCCPAGRCRRPGSRRQSPRSTCRRRCPAGSSTTW